LDLYKKSVLAGGFGAHLGKSKTNKKLISERDTIKKTKMEEILSLAKVAKNGGKRESPSS